MEIFQLHNTSVIHIKALCLCSFNHNHCLRIVITSGLLFYPIKFVYLGLTTDTQRLQRYICFGCNNPYFLHYERNNAFDYNELENVSLDFSSFVICNFVHHMMLAIILVAILACCIQRCWLYIIDLYIAFGDLLAFLGDRLEIGEIIVIWSYFCIVFCIIEDPFPVKGRIHVSAPRLDSDRGGYLQDPPPKPLDWLLGKWRGCASYVKMHLICLRRGVT